MLNLDLSCPCCDIYHVRANQVFIKVKRNLLEDSSFEDILLYMFEPECWSSSEKYRKIALGGQHQHNKRCGKCYTT